METGEALKGMAEKQLEELRAKAKKRGNTLVLLMGGFIASLIVNFVMIFGPVAAQNRPAISVYEILAFVVFAGLGFALIVYVNLIAATTIQVDRLERKLQQLVGSAG